MLPLTSLALFLRDLLDKRHADLAASKAGKYFLPQLEDARKELDALPAALTGAEPLAEELAEIDMRHDGHGRVIWYTTEATLQDPNADAETKSAAQRVRDGFIRKLDELMDKFTVEASRAEENKAKLAELKKDLERFEVAGKKKRTLHDVAAAYVAAGLEIGVALSKRGDVPKAARAKAGPLAAKIVGLSGRVRAEIAREVARDPKLPRDLEARVFGYWDTLEEMARSAKGTSKGGGAPGPLPGPGVGGPKA